MASILPSSTSGANELTRLWEAGLTNKLPRQITIRVVALRIIQLIATRQIPVPDQSLCLLGAVRVYYKLAQRLKSELSSLHNTMLSVDFVQKKIDGYTTKLAHQTDAKLNAGSAKIKKDIIRAEKDRLQQKQQQQQQLQLQQQQKRGGVGPSPSTGIVTGRDGEPEGDRIHHIDGILPYQQYEYDDMLIDNTDQEYYDEQDQQQQRQQRQGQFDQKNIFQQQNQLNLLQQFNHDFDYLNPQHQNELLDAINDVEAMGKDELAYLYNIGQDIAPQRDNMADATGFDNLDLSGYSIDGGYDASILGQSFMNRTGQSNTVMVRDDHNSNNVNLSRLSIGSPLPGDKYDQFDMNNNQFGGMGGFDGGLGGIQFDDLSSPMHSDVEGGLNTTLVDPITGLPMDTTFTGFMNRSAASSAAGIAQQQQQKLPGQTGAFQGLSDFLFNIVIGSGTDPMNPLLASQQLQQQQQQQQVKVKKPRQKKSQQQQQQQQVAGEGAAGAGARRKAALVANALPLSKLQYQRKINNNDIDAQISITPPDLGTDEVEQVSVPSTPLKRHGDGVYDEELYFSDKSEQYLLSSESSTINVRDIHGGITSVGKGYKANIVKFTEKNDFSNPTTLLSPFKSPQLPPQMQSQESQFSQFDQQKQRRRRTMGDDEEEGYDYHDFDQDEKEIELDLPLNNTYTMSRPLHQQEQFDFSFISNNSAGFSMHAANNYTNLQDELVFLNETMTTTTTKSSLIELFDTLTVTPVDLVPVVINAQRDAAVSMREVAVNVEAPSSHKLNRLTMLQSTLTKDISSQYPVMTLMGLEQERYGEDIDGISSDEGELDLTFDSLAKNKKKRTGKKSSKTVKGTTTTTRGDRSNNDDYFDNYGLDLDDDGEIGLIENDFLALQDNIEAEIDSKFTNFNSIANITNTSLSSAFQSYFTTNPSGQLPLQALVQRKLRFGEGIGDDGDQQQQQPPAPLLTTNPTSSISNLIHDNIIIQRDLQHHNVVHNVNIKPIQPIIKKQTKQQMIEKNNELNTFAPLVNVPALEEYDPSMHTHNIMLPSQSIANIEFNTTTTTTTTTAKDITNLDIYTAPLAQPHHIPIIAAVAAQFDQNVQFEQHKLTDNQDNVLSNISSIFHEVPFVESTLNTTILSDLNYNDQYNTNILELQFEELRLNNIIKQFELLQKQQQQQQQQQPAETLPETISPLCLDSNIIDQHGFTQALQRINLNDLINARNIIINARKLYNQSLWQQQRLALTSKQLPIGGITTAIPSTTAKTTTGGDDIDQQDIHLEGFSSDGGLNSDDFLLNEDYYTSSLLFPTTTFQTADNQLLQDFRPDMGPVGGVGGDLSMIGDGNQAMIDKYLAQTQQQFMHYDGDVVIDFALNSTSSDILRSDEQRGTSSSDEAYKFDSQTQLNVSNLSIGTTKQRDQYGKILDLTSLGGIGIGDDDDIANLSSFGLDFSKGDVSLDNIDNKLLLSFQNQHNKQQLLQKNNQQLMNMDEEYGDLIYDSGELDITQDGMVESSKKTLDGTESEKIQKKTLFDDNDTLLSEIYSEMTQEGEELSSSGMLTLSDTIHDLDNWAKQQDLLLSSSRITSPSSSMRIKTDGSGVMGEEEEKQEDGKQQQKPLFSYQDTIKSLGYDSKHLLHLILAVFKEKSKLIQQENVRKELKIKLDKHQDFDSSLSSSDIDNNTNNSNNINNNLVNTITLNDIVDKRFNTILQFYKKHNRKADKITHRHVASSTFFLILHLVKHGLIFMKQDGAYNIMKISLIPFV